MAVVLSFHLAFDRVELEGNRVLHKECRNTQNAPTPHPTAHHVFPFRVSDFLFPRQAKKAQEAELSALFDEALLTGVKKVRPFSCDIRHMRA